MKRVNILTCSPTPVFLRQTDKTGKFRGTGIRTASCFKALLKKELSRFTSSATYMTNCGFGAVMLLLMGVGSFFLSDELIAQFGLNAEEAGSIIPMIITCAMMFFACLSPTTYPSISLEGSSFWILKSAPVRETRNRSIRPSREEPWKMPY